MFKGKKQTINPDTTDTVVGEGTEFEGKIQSKASILIVGEITGNIECEGDVMIGENGKAHSNISAREVTITGTVYGNITAIGKLSITSKGKLYGNTQVASLEIDQGGVFEGTSKMEGKDSATKATTSTPNPSTPPPSTESQNNTQYVQFGSNKSTD